MKGKLEVDASESFKSFQAVERFFITIINGNIYKRFTCLPNSQRTKYSRKQWKNLIIP